MKEGRKEGRKGNWEKERMRKKKNGRIHKWFEKVKERAQSAKVTHNDSCTRMCVCLCVTYILFLLGYVWDCIKYVVMFVSCLLGFICVCVCVCVSPFTQPSISIRGWKQLFVWRCVEEEERTSEVYHSIQTFSGNQSEGCNFVPICLVQGQSLFIGFQRTERRTHTYTHTHTHTHNLPTPIQTSSHTHTHGEKWSIIKNRWNDLFVILCAKCTSSHWILFNGNTC